MSIASGLEDILKSVIQDAIQEAIQKVLEEEFKNFSYSQEIDLNEIKSAIRDEIQKQFRKSSNVKEQEKDWGDLNSTTSESEDDEAEDDESEDDEAEDDESEDDEAEEDEAEDDEAEDDEAEDDGAEDDEAEEDEEVLSEKLKKNRLPVINKNGFSSKPKKKETKLSKLTTRQKYLIEAMVEDDQPKATRMCNFNERCRHGNNCFNGHPGDNLTLNFQLYNFLLNPSMNIEEYLTLNKIKEKELYREAFLYLESLLD